MKPKPKAIPADVVAASYVELTVAIVTLEQRLEALEHHFDELLVAFQAYITVLDEKDPA